MATLTADNPLKSSLERIAPLIGNTPLLALNLPISENVHIYAKLEWQQYSGSVKARAAFNIIKTAIEHGDLQKGKTLLDASSGNTALAYAAIGAALQIPVCICLPENASETRKTMLKAYGVDLVYTSPFGGTDEAQEVAAKMASENEHYFYANQYSNDANWLAHYHGTGPEIESQLNGFPEYFVAGLGTTGTVVGTARYFAEQGAQTKIVGLQPDAILHGLEGWKHLESAVQPKIYDEDLLDEVLEIDTYEAFKLIKTMAKTQGLLLSPSAAANLAGALAIAEKIDSGSIVTVFADDASKYTEILKKLNP